MVRGSLLCFAFAIGACQAARPAAPEPQHARDAALDLSSAASVSTHLRVPPEERERSMHYARAVVRGWEIMQAFAAQHGWSKAAAVRTFDAVEVHTSTAALWKRVIELNHLPTNTPIPQGAPTAALEGRVLLTITEAEHARVFPEYASLPESLARVLAHEMVHRLHVAIVGGNEDRMGPRWFYEGFAVIGSGQDFDIGVLAYASADEALAGAESKDEPRMAYRRYAATLRYFMSRQPLPSLVERAGERDFEATLRLR